MQRIVNRAILALTGAVLSASPSLSQSKDLVYEPSVAWNGYKVYVSPAVHADAGRRGECQNGNENDLALTAANADALMRALRGRGYQVRVGRGTVASAIRNSNAWGADIHVIMHSNAKGTAANACHQTANNRYGTNVIYRINSNLGRQLAELIVDHLGPASPGTADYVCYNPGHSCTKIDLGELRETRAVAAYSESEFHDWNIGYTWLARAGTWAHLLADAIDEFLDYPRR